VQFVKIFNLTLGFQNAVVTYFDNKFFITVQILQRINEGFTYYCRHKSVLTNKYNKNNVCKVYKWCLSYITFNFEERAVKLIRCTLNYVQANKALVVVTALSEITTE